MNPNTRKYILILAVIIFIFAAAYFIYQKNNVSEYDENVWRTNQEQMVSEIIKSGDESKCASINYIGLDGSDYRSVCKNNILYSKAIDKLDVSYCVQIEPSFLDPKLCEESIISQKLSINNDLAICGEVSNPTLKGDCEEIYLLNQGVKTSDTSFCSKITNDYRKTRCFDEISAFSVTSQKGVVNCSVALDTVKEDCEILKSFQTDENQREDLCHQIKNIVIQNKCFSRS